MNFKILFSRKKSLLEAFRTKMDGLNFDIKSLENLLRDKDQFSEDEDEVKKIYSKK